MLLVFHLGCWFVTGMSNIPSALSHIQTGEEGKAQLLITQKQYQSQGQGLLHSIHGIRTGTEDKGNIDYTLVDNRIDLRNRITNAVLGSIPVPSPKDSNYSIGSLSNLFTDPAIKRLLDDLDSDTSDMRLRKAELSNALRLELDTLREQGVKYDKQLKQWETARITASRRRDLFAAYLAKFGINYLPSINVETEATNMRKLQKAERGRVKFSDFIKSGAFKKATAGGVARYSRMQKQLKVINDQFLKDKKVPSTKYKDMVNALDKDIRTHLVRRLIAEGNDFIDSTGNRVRLTDVARIEEIAEAAFLAGHAPVTNVRDKGVLGRAASAVKKSIDTYTLQIQNNKFQIGIGIAEGILPAVQAIIQHFVDPPRKTFAAPGSLNEFEGEYNSLRDASYKYNKAASKTYKKTKEAYDEFLNNPKVRNAIANMGDHFVEIESYTDSPITKVLESEKLTYDFDEDVIAPPDPVYTATQVGIPDNIDQILQSVLGYANIQYSFGRWRLEKQYRR